MSRGYSGLAERSNWLFSFKYQQIETITKAHYKSRFSGHNIVALHLACDIEEDDRMQTTKRPLNLHDSYHAHIYFDEKSKLLAKEICDKVIDSFGLSVGRFHERLVGPHRRWSCQIIFGKNDFDEFIPWLDSHRGDLSVFVHGLTGDDLKDHTDYAYWLGDDVGVNAEIFDNA